MIWGANMIKLIRWPTDSKRITSSFGPRWGDFHDGIDIGAIRAGVPGDSIYSVADGKVIISKVNGGGVTKGYGYYVAIQHDGFCSLYGHLQGLIVNVGQVIKAGQIIGKMGNTGTSTAAHLHFRLIEGNGVSFDRLDNGRTKGSIDPVPFLNEIGKEVIKVAEVKQEVSSWAKEAWDWAIKEKITDGTNPKGPITREQVATMIYRALKGAK